MNTPLFDFKIFARPELEKFRSKVKGRGAAHLLVVASTSAEYQEEDQAFLAKVLGAVKLAPLDENVYLLLLQSEEKAPLADLAKTLNVEHVLLFGTEPHLLGIRAQLPLYEFVKIGDLSLFLSHSLQDIQTERQAGKKEKAAALWRALKAKFI